MVPGEVVFHGSVRNQEILVRYPTLDDVSQLQEFVNTASRERTCIRLQGETFTLEEEAQYLDTVIDQIKSQSVVKLLVFCQSKLIAAGDVSRQPLANRHLGRFGIVVKKEARGRGIGRKLTELVIEQTKRQLPEVEKIILSVFDSNVPARTLYESLGFIEYGRLPHGLKLVDRYEDEIEMYLPLLHPN